MNRTTVGRAMEILLVEDNLQDAQLTMEALKQKQVPCRISLVCDGEEALQFLHRKQIFARAPRPDLILLDMQLPRQSGPQVLSDIRADEELAKIPVVVLTASLVHKAVLQAQNLRVDGYMTKPVSLDQFIATVKSLRQSWVAEMILPSSS